MDKFSLYFRKAKILEWLVIIIISAGLGLAWFLVLYGRFSIYPTHVYWIYTIGRDPLQHQLGWEFFRKEPWSFPLGTIKAYGYPYGTSVTFLDSIPLFAFFFKIISPLLHKDFQYLGLWELTSVIGQFLVGFLIFKEFTRSYILRILGASLLVLSPTMIFRSFFHSSLSAQWIVLLAILFVILEYRHKFKRWGWYILFGLAMLVHLYFIPMILPLWGISLFFRFRNERKILPLVLESIGIILEIFLIGFCIGIFGINMKSLAESGFGQYSWNLNAFFNSMGKSKFIPGLPVFTDDQNEGYSYLGLGYFLLIAVSSILFFIKDPSRKNWKFFVPFIVVSIVYILIALSNKAYLNLTPLWNIKLPNSIENIFNLFRSSGRFIWPVFYFLILFGIITLLRNFKYVAIPILIIALVLQFIDIQPLSLPKKMTGFSGFYTAGMNSDFWRIAGESNKSIMILPTEYYDHLVLFAVHHNMTINSGYFGRADYNAMEDYATRIWDGLFANQIDDQTLYVLSDQQHVELAKEKLAKKMYDCNIDGYTILFSAKNPLLKVKSDFVFNWYCSIPAP
jgi:hypothetical protein